MNTTFLDTQRKPRVFFIALIALLAMMAIVLTANIGTLGNARVALPSLSIKTIQGETKLHSALPVPVPVPTPPTVQNGATATPVARISRAMQSQVTATPTLPIAAQPTPVPQPVPTPPVNQ